MDIFDSIDLHFSTGPRGAVHSCFTTMISFAKHKRQMRDIEQKQEQEQSSRCILVQVATRYNEVMYVTNPMAAPEFLGKRLHGGGAG